jgi:hypothetical protein
MLLGRGDGTFGKEIACGLALATEVSGNLIADFDHDQKMDMVAGSPGVMLGMNGCNFTTLVSIPDWGDTPDYGGWSGGPAGAADLDGDGNTDIITSPIYEEKMAVHLGDGRGGFAAPASFPIAGPHLGGVYLIGDLNNDTKLDIIVTRPGGWQVLLNTCP